MSISPYGGTPRPRPGRALLVLLLGLVLIAVAGVAVRRTTAPADFEAQPVTVAGPPASATPRPAVSGAAGSGVAKPAAVVPVRDGALPADVTADAPTRVRIPALGLDAAVTPAGIDARTGYFAVPARVDRVGWYRYGPGFSAREGSVVLAGHVDGATQGEGALFRLGTLKAGDTVTLVGPGGRTRDFEVVARARHRKTAVPLVRYFARDGEPRLTLITCGGPFDEARGNYRDNVVVTAIPRT